MQVYLFIAKHFLADRKTEVQNIRDVVLKNPTQTLVEYLVQTLNVRKVVRPATKKIVNRYLYLYHISEDGFCRVNDFYLSFHNKDKRSVSICV